MYTVLICKATSSLPAISRASTIFDQEGGGLTRFNQVLNISQRQALLSPWQFDLICSSCPSSISNSMPMYSHSLETLVCSTLRTFFRVSGFSDTSELEWVSWRESPAVLWISTSPSSAEHTPKLLVSTCVMHESIRYKETVENTRIACPYTIAQTLNYTKLN